MATIVGTWLASDLAVEALRKSTGQNLEEVAVQLRDKIETDLHARYLDLTIAGSFASQNLGTSNVRDVSAVLDTLHDSFSSYAWIGLVDTNGAVLESTDGLLKGVNVNHRPWFQKALTKPFVGDAHEAVLLAEKLENPSGSPLRFVDVAVPLRADDGSVWAVLGAHLYLDWVADMGQSFLAPLQERLKSELIVADNKGSILIGPPASVGKQLPESLIKATQKQMSGYETLPMDVFDGGEVTASQRYLVGFSPLRDRPEYESFDWLVLVRKPAAAAFQPARDLQNSLMLGGALVAGVLTIFAGLAARRTTRPLLKMARQAQRLDPEDPDSLIQLRDEYDEVKTLSSVLRDLIRRLADKTHEMNELNQSLEHRVVERTRELESVNLALEQTVRTDSLTGTNNRRYYFELGQIALKKALRSGAPISVIMFDADHFKTINDSFGHAVGDKALIHLCRMAENAIRDIDVLARIGGEEFAVLLENTDEEAAAIVAERIRTGVGDHPLSLERGELNLSVSVGVASFHPEKSDDLDALLLLADKALYAAKAGGRNQVCRYSALDPA